MKSTKLFLSLGIFIMCLAIVVAIPWSPSGNVDLKNVFNMTNLNFFDSFTMVGNVLMNMNNITGADLISAVTLVGDGGGITGLTNTHLHDISNITNFNYSYNQTDGSIVFINAGDTNLQTNISDVNSSLSSRIDGISTAGNSSFNQTLTDGLYAGIEWDYNQTYTDGTYNATYDKWAYNQTGDYSYNQTETFNSTQFEKNEGDWQIITSWLTSFVNSWFSGKDSDDLSEGVVNLYDNQTWNETKGDESYAGIKWAYNQTSEGTFNQTYQDYSYNQTEPANDYTDLASQGLQTNISDVNSSLDSKFNDFNYNMTIVSDYNYNQTTGSLVFINTGDTNLQLNITNVNSSLDTKFNDFNYNMSTPYDDFNYNMSDGSYNITYQDFAYNQTYTDGTYNVTYDGYGDYAYNQSDGSFNITYQNFAYNQTYIDGTFNQTYQNYAYNQSDGSYNISYEEWAYNQTIPANEYADSLLITTYFNASVLGTPVGTPQGSLSDIISYDSVPYNVSESASDLTFLINFTSVDDFNQIIVRYRTEAAESHAVTLYIWDYDELGWESYIILSDTDGEYVIITTGVYDADEHTDGGIVQVKLETDNGPPSRTHKWGFDWVTISKGVATPLGTEIDPLSIHKDGDVALTGNWEAGDYNISADNFIGSWNNYSRVNDTQIENNDGYFNILESWLSTLFDTLFGTKDSDDLSEGSVNLYDNQTFNQTLTDTEYLGLSGGNMTGSLNMSNNTIETVLNITFTYGGYIRDNTTALIIGHS